jgi:hypothetical protein
MPLVKRKTRKQQKSRIKKRTTKSRRKTRSMKGGYDGLPTECSPPCIRSKKEICSDRWTRDRMTCITLNNTYRGNETLQKYWEKNNTTPQYNM